MIQPRKTIGAPEDVESIHHRSHALASRGKCRIVWFMKCESHARALDMNLFAIASAYGICNVSESYHPVKKLYAVSFGFWTEKSANAFAKRIKLFPNTHHVNQFHYF